MSPVPPPRLREAFDSPALKARYVRRLFSTIAPRYDVITRLLSYGQDQRWKARVVALATTRPAPPPSGALRVLDLACGTGDLTFRLARTGASAIGLDVTEAMLVVAERRLHEGEAPAGTVRFLAGDMMALPCPDAAFDVVTAGYGLRNVPSLEPSLREIVRVIRPGGVFVSLDFNRPSNALLRWAYLTYLRAVGATLGVVLHGDSETYRYIPASIVRYPGAPAVAELMTRVGFRTATWMPVLGGLMAIHVAGKAGEGADGAAVERGAGDLR
ncbi:MAG: ubiquinone/menaquinone biosynthesis methyltransferase [Vicinamibacterales bacterium]